jgi:antitoxin HicB
METLEYGYTAIFEKQDDGGYVVTVPALNYITTQGDTLEEARAMVKDMIKVYIQSLQADGLDIPAADSAREIMMEKVSVTVDR